MAKGLLQSFARALTGNKTSVVLVTGANRGLGLEYVRQYAAQGCRVIACTRQPGTEELTALDPELVQVLQLDVTDHAAVDALAAELGDVAIDVLINNAGTTGPQGAPGFMEYSSVDNIDYGIWRDIMEVNVLGAFKVATAFRPHLARSKRGVLINVSSFAGSLAQNKIGNQYPYRVSKASLNMLTTGLAHDCPEFITVSVVPGWCKTALGGPDAPLDTAASVADQIKTFAGLKQNQSGTFIDRFGAQVPW